MSFDFAAVSAPFRMQPGLRRLAAGTTQLTPNQPGDRALREVARGEGAEYLTISAQGGNPGAITAYREMGLLEQPWHGVRFKVDLTETTGLTA